MVERHDRDIGRVRDDVGEFRDLNDTGKPSKRV
jgi:hypothetical protein